jgi:excisionase family DNA binding protein
MRERNTAPLRAQVPREETLWDKRQAAEYLGLSISWVDKQVAAGKLPYLKFGASVRFDPAELRAWAAAQRGYKGGR